MGSPIIDLFKGEEATVSSLKNKVLAVDAFNLLYQFLTTIRQPDGTPLMDVNGQVTSHLNGLFYRSLTLIEAGLKLVFVFDGKTPELKFAERKRREGLKKEALKKYETAKEQEDIEEMGKYARQTSRLTPDMIEEAKGLITAMGMCHVDAPSEGEAQASHMVKQGDAYAIISQDADSFLFGAPKVIRNLSLTGKRKLAGKLAYKTVSPDFYILKDNLNRLKLTQKQLVMLAILVGTDFNYGGIKGIGPKKALTLVQKYDGKWDELFKEVNWDDFFDFSWKQVYGTFEKMPVTDDYKLSFTSVDVDTLQDLLVNKHGFSEDRIVNALNKLSQHNKTQKGLGEFF